jgi:aminoglycoside phosphotransferase family enzyme
VTAAKRETPLQDQEAVLAFLDDDPECKCVDTHASIVFLGKDRVLKVKRAVRLPFLDYSTLEKRKQA